MDKYELTQTIEKAQKVLQDPSLNFHFCGPDSDEVLEMIEEINNPYRDKEGFVQKYYISEDAKGFIEILLRATQ